MGPTITKLDGTADSIQQATINFDPLIQAVATGKIKPLIAVSGTTLNNDSHVGIYQPDKGKVIELQYMGYNHGTIELSVADTICAGYSGLPLLELGPGNIPTGKSFGHLVEANIPKTAQCVNQTYAYVIPFPTNS